MIDTKREEFEIVELGTTYKLPKYRVVDGEGIKFAMDLDKSTDKITQHVQTITFVRGDKEDNGKIIPRVDGITHEQLLGMMIADMQHKNSIVPSRESSIAITKLQEALMWLGERQYQRKKAGTQGTYRK